MKAASVPDQRPRDGKILIVDGRGNITHAPRGQFADFMRSGDVVVANDAGTLPASIAGTHRRTGRLIEVRLAGRASLASDIINDFLAIVFGEGDYRTRTEDRPAPPELRPGDHLDLAPLRATVLSVGTHPRLVQLRFEGAASEVWAGLARSGRPIQYAHVPSPLQLWDSWTPIAASPVAFEPPSASFILNWNALTLMRARGVLFTTITHAAGISSTGDAAVDALLPFDEPYRIASRAAQLINDARGRGNRVVAIGTTVVRALEHAAAWDGLVRPGEGVATQKITPMITLRIVDAILSGTHEPDSSHYELLGAFASKDTLRRMDSELNAYDYRTHEFGDSVLIEKRLPYGEQQATAA